MIEVHNCVICDGTIRYLKRALVAPFLAKRIWNRNPFCVDLVKCESCGFTFYNPRLDDADLRRLYQDYRLDEYQRMRHSFEPWYTEKFNADLASAASYEIRRSMLSPILREHIGDRKISRVLDYGGDRGDLVVGLLEEAQPFVYDISGVKAASGVISTNDPAECKADLIINSNVLEHVGFPRQIVAGILNASPDGGLVYLEVPCEFPFGLSRIARRTAQVAIVMITRPSIARHILHPASLYMMHEHINYFSELSLTALMRACGGAVISAGRYASSGRAGNADMAWCLGTNQRNRT
jgi:hypothetical protein